PRSPLALFLRRVVGLAVVVILVSGLALAEELFELSDYVLTAGKVRGSAARPALQGLVVVILERCFLTRLELLDVLLDLGVMHQGLVHLPLEAPSRPFHLRKLEAKAVDLAQPGQQ